AQRSGRGDSVERSRDPEGQAGNPGESRWGMHGDHLPHKAQARHLLYSLGGWNTRPLSVLWPSKLRAILRNRTGVKMSVWWQVPIGLSILCPAEESTPLYTL